MAMVAPAPATGIWRRVMFVLCLLSGISGLLYEVVWARMLHLLFGDTVLAVSTVLASFMAGLALGSFVIGRSIDRRSRVLTIYAALEVGIGLSALLFLAVLQLLTPVYVWLHQSVSFSLWLVGLVRFLLAFCFLCIPATLIGGALSEVWRYVL